ncbi:MAG: LLM class F420-dependent oxidoreductase [Deltaproteobacteria bacterium]|nr:LLM class F420-dependent oxidoreductase [Deltaproteobacteria bacterium]
MKVGVLAFLTEQSGNPGAIACEAENLGFESFWVAEHMVMPSHYTVHYPRSADGKVPEFYAHLIDPFIALAIAAQATSRIRIGTAICLLPERNVIETAKSAACIDFYSGGRLSFGIGAGWFPEEARIMGVDFARRWRHLRESVEALRLLWARDDVGYEGEIIKFPPVRLYPRPVQKPGPPILLGAHDPKYALRRAARYADGWCPGGLTVEKARECIPQIQKMAKEEYGRDPKQLEFSVLLMGSGEGPSADVMKRYAEAGVSRLVVAAAGSAHSDGVRAVQAAAPMVERASRLDQ